MTTAIIGPTMAKLVHGMRLLGMPIGDYVLMTPGSATVGMFDDVILMGWHPGDGETPRDQDRGQAWWDEAVRTRRPPGRQGYVYVSMPCVEFPQNARPRMP